MVDLQSDLFTAPLTGDMDITKFVIGAVVFATVAIVTFIKLQKLEN